MPRRALVTGVTGQDGSYLLEQLLAEGTEVHGLVQGRAEAEAALAGYGLAGLLARVSLHEGDLLDGARCAGLVAEIAPDELYNLAGISSVGFSWQEPVLTGRVSGVAVADLLQAAWELQERRGTPVRVVQASSAEIFGAAESSPQDERTPIRPSSPYGAAKAYAHHMVGVYRARGLAASACVLYNHESPRRPAAFVTRKITRGAARIAAGLDTELVLGNLDARRDWGWAPDYVDAMVRAARASEPGDFVIATGRSRTVADLVAAAFAAAGVEDWQAHVRTDPAFVRPVDAVDQVGDASRARDVLGWHPTVGFDEVVARMVRADVEEIGRGDQPA